MSSEEEPRCRCCDLPLYSCGTELAKRQAKDRQARAERALEEPGVIRARHPGRCPSCRSLFPVGEPVTKTRDGWVSVLCCPESLDR